MLQQPPKKYFVNEFGHCKTYCVPYNQQKLFLVVSVDEHPNGLKWEHVSVSLKKRVPTYQEMCFVKSLCWDAEDEVIHFFPRQSEHVNIHENCLHLWRPIGVKLPWDDEE